MMESSKGGRLCSRAEDVAAYIAGALREPDARVLEAHAADCSACRELLSALARGAEPADAGPEHTSSRDSRPVTSAAPERALALAGSTIGRYEIHEQLGLALGERVLSPDDPSMAATRYDLGIRLRRLGHFAEARAQLLRAEAIVIKVFGSDHVYVAFVVAQRADLLMLQSRWADAAALYDRVIPRFEASQGAAEPLATSIANRCRASLEMHQPPRGLPQLEQLARTVDAYPREIRVVIEFALARALWDTGGDRKRARELAAQALADIHKVADARRDDVAQIERWLASHRAVTH
jgi:hypothetical protein